MKKITLTPFKLSAAKSHSENSSGLATWSGCASRIAKFRKRGFRGRRLQPICCNAPSLKISS